MDKNNLNFFLFSPCSLSPFIFSHLYYILQIFNPHFSFIHFFRRIARLYPFIHFAESIKIYFVFEICCSDIFCMDDASFWSDDRFEYSFKRSFRVDEPDVFRCLAKAEFLQLMRDYIFFIERDFFIIIRQNFIAIPYRESFLIKRIISGSCL